MIEVPPRYGYSAEIKTYQQLWAWNNKVRDYYLEVFLQIFGSKVMRSFFDESYTLMGFDVVRFDKEVVKSEDGQSMAEALEAKFGEPARRLIEQILKDHLGGKREDDLASESNA